MNIFISQLLTSLPDRSLKLCIMDESSKAEVENATSVEVNAVMTAAPPVPEIISPPKPHPMGVGEEHSKISGLLGNEECDSSDHEDVCPLY
jgi:hypothetical protein